MNPDAQEIVKRYLAGELDLESAAKGIHTGGEFGLYYSPGITSLLDQERLESLLGRVLWLGLRESSSDNAPDQPFGAAEFRAIANGVFFDSTDET